MDKDASSVIDAFLHPMITCLNTEDGRRLFEQVKAGINLDHLELVVPTLLKVVPTTMKTFSSVRWFSEFEFGMHLFAFFVLGRHAEEAQMDVFGPLEHLVKRMKAFGCCPASAVKLRALGLCRRTAEAVLCVGDGVGRLSGSLPSSLPA